MTIVRCILCGHEVEDGAIDRGRAAVQREIRVCELERLASIILRPGCVRRSHDRDTRAGKPRFFSLPRTRSSLRILWFLREQLTEDRICELLSDPCWGVTAEDVEAFRRKTPKLGPWLLAIIDRALNLHRGKNLQTKSLEEEILEAILGYEWDRPSFLFLITKAREDDILADLYLTGEISDVILDALFQYGFVDAEYVERLKSDAITYMNDWRFETTGEVRQISSTQTA